MRADEYDRFCKSLKDAAREQLIQFVENYSPSDFRPQLVIQEGMAIDCILSYAQNRATNLIVIGTHGVPGSDRVALGSVTEKVLRKAGCSVLAVHGGVQAQIEVSDGAIQVRRSFFCTDFSQYSDDAFDCALSVATEFKANLTVLHVIGGISRLHAKRATADVQDKLRQLISGDHTRACNIISAVRSGRAYKEISQFAGEKHAHLVIMAVHGGNALIVLP